MKLSRSVLSILCIGALLLAFMAGCGSDAATSESETAQTSQNPETTETASPESSEGAEAAIPATGDEFVLPICAEPTTYTFWMGVSSYAVNYVTDPAADLTVFKEIADRTNIHFDITAVSDTVKDEQFNLMVAGGDYCDILTSVGTLYSTGLEGAYEDEVVIDLYDLVLAYAPNYWEMLNRDEDSVRTMVIGEDNRMLALALQFHEPGYGGGGLLTRLDLLDSLGLGRPETYDEFHDMLAAMYQETGAQMMITETGISEDLVCGYNVVGGFYVVDGIVRYGFVEDAMYDYLTMISQWYAEGLIDPDFYSADTFDGVNGLGDGQISVASGRPTTIAEVEAASSIEGIRIGALDYPTPTGAEQIHVGGTSTTSYIRNSSVWSISTACEDPIPLIQLCDYLNTDEGIELFNYGVENEAFVYGTDGMPQWTELITNNPDGMTYAQAAYVYASSAGSEYLPSVFDETKAYYAYTDAQWEAVEVFAAKSDGAYDYPTGATLTADEAYAISSMESSIETHVEETVLRWVTGETALTPESWESLGETLESMGLSQIQATYQTAYDRYMSN